ncbi:3-deoxy-7-phosphoheptulonate synthase [Parasphaerochaeta coccoides]|uniref:Phospho-2-dehydro-3-deoxyheptonate aldolase n=1 Tax=Parasphaerochaeta coccoides (strain ATCC BAA-1237 / DSM 17374 / SPN1) TaxID=760011 RepID=F4GHY8_PARC1|nr:3-deoxy-7-phosphoheptulonate synthase [Parasphaerochaeta coccoides]AEC02101.1 3-deoxy-D-arabinoheptulosonate-7-phosphate synthase [Parasphaerochaeta coccoides DSM 17374]
MNNSDIRIQRIDSLVPPSGLVRDYPVTEQLAEEVSRSRRTVNDIIRGRDRRLLAVIGPCSIHDEKAALEYAALLKELAQEVEDEFYIVMRTYFEKPRTVLGWKGLVLDPDMDGSYDIEKGLTVARRLLLQITSMGMPVGCEVLDPIVPQYIDELISWSSIGARTSESQTHRTLASGLSVAVGFKNSTSGDLTNAINAIRSAASPASFIGIDKHGNTVILRTTGNDCGHLILRGGDTGPNYYEDSVENAARLMTQAGLDPSILIDCSHGNSNKKPGRQKRVLRSILEQILWGETSIRGFMLESNLRPGCQSLGDDPMALEYGISITDPCMGWDETRTVVTEAYRMLKDARSDGRSAPIF